MRRFSLGLLLATGMASGCVDVIGLTMARYNTVQQELPPQIDPNSPPLPQTKAKPKQAAGTNEPSRPTPTPEPTAQPTPSAASLAPEQVTEENAYEVAEQLQRELNQEALELQRPTP